MKVREAGIGAINKNYCVFDLSGFLKEVGGAYFGDWEGIETANIFLGYGYMDQEAGLTVEVLAMGRAEGKVRVFMSPNDEVSDKIRIANLMDVDFTVVSEESVPDVYKEKVRMIKEDYGEFDGIEESGEMHFPDECPSPDYEASKEDVVKNYILRFKSNPNMEDYVKIIILLLNMDIWVPCTAVLSEEDERQFLDLIEKAGGDLSSLTEEVVISKDPTRLIPDVLKSGDEFYFPIFTSVEEMGEYGEHFSKVGRKLEDVLRLARNNEKDIRGIVVNAFSKSFVIDKEYWDLIEEVGNNDERE